MEDTNRIRLIMIGIVLCVVAAGYLLFSQANKAFRGTNITASPSPLAVVVPTATPISLRVVTPSPTPVASSKPAVAGVANSNQKNLPNTGFPTELVGVFALSAAIIGYSLRKYPQ